MKKIYIYISIIVVLAPSIFIGIWLNHKYFEIGEFKITNTSTVDPKNSTFKIDNKEITLINGKSETESAPGSATKIATTYFGNNIQADLDKDGRTDNAFLVTQDTGGSGIFYYLVADLNKESSEANVDASFIGDRITPENISIGKNNVIIVNYADRKVGEDFSVAPTVAKSIWLKLDTNTMEFGEVMQNFEGEVDPDKMTLDMKTWVWYETIYNNDPKEKISLGKMYTISFDRKDKTFSATTDCNRISGKYKLGLSYNIIFTDIISTEMYCAGSNDSAFAKLLSDVSTFGFTNKGELKLNMKFDFGTLVFK